MLFWVHISSIMQVITGTLDGESVDNLLWALHSKTCCALGLQANKKLLLLLWSLLSNPIRLDHP